jgi:hypothetical protein
MQKKYLKIWLILSSFGIMFAILSWVQESNIIDPNILISYKKGVLAIITGLFLYKYVAKRI